jgi:hypothetical protein
MTHHTQESFSPAVIGEYYTAVVPNTLDLAERARLGISHCCAVLDEDNRYVMYFRGWRDRIEHHICDHIIQPKQFEAMAMLRVMCGSLWGLEREAAMIETMVWQLGEEGLWWVPRMGGAMPWMGAEEVRPYLNPHTPFRMVRAMMAWYQYTGDALWKERTDRMVSAINRYLVAHKDGYAYIPVPANDWNLTQATDYMTACYTAEHRWEGFIEPQDEKTVDGTEGSVLCGNGHSGGALANWYLLTGNREALDLAGEFTRFYTKPRFWADWSGGEYGGVVGAEHAHWNGHIHGHINTLRAVLEYALATGDIRLMAWVRDGYEWTRQPTMARYGVLGDLQGCGCGRLIGLAIKLTDAGIGDYWEDVDLYIRNMGTEMQFTPEDVPGHTLPVPSGTLDPEGALIGGFAATASKEAWMGCCSPHGQMGLYYAWEGTLRFKERVARINLLLNRASPWLDIDSYLPYEGRVVVRNKQARTVVIRLPLWVDKKQVTVKIGGKVVLPEWSGQYARLDNLDPGDVVTITFPMVEWTETLSAPRWERPNEIHPASPKPAEDEATIITLRGNTIVRLSKPLLNSALFMARASKYTGKTTPMIEVDRFITPRVLKW